MPPSNFAVALFIVIAMTLPEIAYADSGSADKKAPEIKVFGRVMYDFAHAEGDNTSFSISEPELRRARIGAEIKFKGRGKIKAEINTNDSGDVVFTDLYGEVETGLDLAKIRIGQFKTPNSFDEQSSSRFITLLERSAFTDAFELNRRVGVAVTGKTKRYTHMLGVFGQNIDADDTFGGMAVAGRVTFSPEIRATNTGANGMVLHTGASFRYRRNDTGQPQIRYRQRPVTHIPGRILGTGRIAQSDLFFGAEAALVKGPFWAAGELAVTFAECAACTDDPSFSGGYLEAGWMLGGKQRIKGGKFDRPKFDGGRYGAASFVVRYDRLDLNNASVAGGDYHAVIAGADWWPKKYLRLGVNGFIANADLGAVPSGLDPAFADAITNGTTEETVKGFILRAQIDFWTKL